MFYRVRLDLAFADSTNPGKVRDHGKKLLSKAVIINEGQENEERGYIMVEKCYHDEDPAKPCELLGTWQIPLP